jgi:DNA helicase-2/ATP-dependent DNA helicase PcrA
VQGSRIAAPRADGRAGEQHAGLLRRAEVRDVLAWMRLLVDPQDASAVVRALSRPPIELRQVDLARVIQVARRRKLDLVVGLSAATEAPQVPPEARERIQRFAELHRLAAAEMRALEPDVFVASLIERVATSTRNLLAPEEAAAQSASLERLRELAERFVRSDPTVGVRELTRHLAAALPEAEREDRELERAAHDAGLGEASAGDEQEPDSARTRAELQAMLEALREELLQGVARIGGRLGELRLDTDLDISHGVVRYLELLKLSALLQRPDGQSLEDALADVNARLLAAATPLQREIFQTSTLDETLTGAGSAGGAAGDGGAHDATDAGAGERARARAVAPREQHSLGPFLPRKGIGLALSASDIHTYRSCPLRYKFARVLRIPTEQTVHQRFGIVVHQVLERYHADGGGTLEQMLALLDAGWRRAGFGDSERDRELFDKARDALPRYHARLGGEGAPQPVWFERQFDFRLGPHHLRGRVDRVDRVAGAAVPATDVDRGAVGHTAGAEFAAGDYALIDYKTSRPKTAEQLHDDIQLSLYALAAREDWGLESSQQAYYYVLDDLKVPVARDERDAEWVTGVVLEVGEGILAQEFEPTPSRAACSICDYRIVCPAAEG